MENDLENASHVLIHQTIDKIERLNPCICPFSSKIGFFCCPCEKENTYIVYKSSEDFYQGVKIYEFKEKSQFLSKCILPPSLRGSDIEGYDCHDEKVKNSKKILIFFDINNYFIHNFYLRSLF